MSRHQQGGSWEQLYRALHRLGVKQEKWLRDIGIAAVVGGLVPNARNLAALVICDEAFHN